MGDETGDTGSAPSQVDKERQNSDPALRIQDRFAPRQPEGSVGWDVCASQGGVLSVAIDGEHPSAGCRATQRRVTRRSSWRAAW